MHHALIFAGNRDDRTYDLGILHTFIAVSHLLHQIHPGLFHPADVIGMMYDPHLVCLIIFDMMFIRLNF